MKVIKLLEYGKHVSIGYVYHTQVCERHTVMLTKGQIERLLTKGFILK